MCVFHNQLLRHKFLPQTEQPRDAHSLGGWPAPHQPHRFGRVCFLLPVMLHFKTVSALTGAPGGPLQRLIFPRRARSTVTSASATQAHTNRRTGGGGGGSGRSSEQDVPAQSECAAGQPGRTGPGVVSVSFDQTREAYKSKDSVELLRSLVVFKLCSYDFLVDRNQEVMVSFYRGDRCPGQTVSIKCLHWVFNCPGDLIATVYFTCRTKM